MVRQEIKKAIAKVTELKPNDVHLETPEIEAHGDFATNVAMILSKKEGKKPRELAEEIKAKLENDEDLGKAVGKIEVAGPGFINFWLTDAYLISNLTKVLEGDKYYKTNAFNGKKYMFEFAHPNTHKELHIGHMRTLILGEALSRLNEASGAKVFRANYQGDIGPHVAKAIWGTEKLLEEKKESWDDAEKLTDEEKAHLLGEGYVRGVADYEDEELKPQIDELNAKLYEKDESVKEVYERTRGWSLKYYDNFYNRFYVNYDKLYFESEVEAKGKKIVESYKGKVFEESEGAVIFDGEKHNLHKRVFITKDGNPTYEAKEMALVPTQFADFPFDTNVHVVANEQKGYFEVVFKAMELIDENFKGRLFHLPMGMVNLVGKKMSSRTGEIFKVDELLDEVKGLLIPMLDEDLKGKEKDDVAEMITVGAVKWWMLRTSPMMDIVFDIKKSVSLEGNSGPYMQYTCARARSVLKKAKINDLRLKGSGLKMNDQERGLMRTFAQFSGVIVDASKNYSSNQVCTYLFDLAQKFNSFYNSNKIIGGDNEELRLALTAGTAETIKRGLDLLGIKAPQRM